MRTILIVLITSLFWAIGIYIHREYGDQIKYVIEHAEEISESIEDKAEAVEKSIEKAVKQTKHTSVAVTPKQKTTPVAKQPKAEQQKVEQPKVEQKVAEQPEVEQPKVEQKVAEQPKAPAKSYGELICGYWDPIEGNIRPLEISKYGTIVRWYISGDYKSEWNRRQYIVSGNQLTVNNYYKCTVNVFEENGDTYLEVYGHEEYAGKYRKVIKKKK